MQLINENNKKFFSQNTHKTLWYNWKIKHYYNINIVRVTILLQSGLSSDSSRWWGAFGSHGWIVASERYGTKKSLAPSGLDAVKIGVCISRKPDSVINFLIRDIIFDLNIKLCIYNLSTISIRFSWSFSV